MLTLSINPWYYCNYRCEFCYLTEEQLSDKKLLDLDRLSEMLAEVSSQSKIMMVDLYGGELGLLPKDYWNSLIDLLHIYGIYDINLITNLSMVNDITTDERVYTSVSFDFEAREDYQRVWRNMAMLNKPFSILMLASPNLIIKEVGEMIQTLNVLKNLESVEIKPYSTNQSNQLNIKYSEYESFVQNWITYSDKNFSFTNELLIESVLDKTRNSFSDDHIYITPEGKYGVLEFDLNDNEFFLEYDTLDEYWQWCEKEKHRVGLNKYCSSCEYYGNCLSEHLREVKSLDESCNGFKHLIDWYKQDVSRKN
jgi:sulfatase maturation enzyme AslB (radical SAM superfamily)